MVLKVFPGILGDPISGAGCHFSAPPGQGTGQAISELSEGYGREINLHSTGGAKKSSHQPARVGADRERGHGFQVAIFWSGLG